MSSIFELENPTFDKAFQRLSVVKVAAARALTADEIINGLVISDNAIAQDVDLPKTEDVLKALPDGIQVNDSFKLIVKNDKAGTCTLRVNNNDDNGTKLNTSLMDVAENATNQYVFVIKKPTLKSDGTARAESIDVFCIATSTTDS